MFQSTHSLRSATVSANRTRDRTPVSIHALLAECDLCGGQSCAVSDGFNPRTPCGVRPFDENNLTLYFKFQSTHSLRSATFFSLRSFPPFDVSIHALLAECDPCRNALNTSPACFNPRTPCGVRPLPERAEHVSRLFQSTHSLRSATYRQVRNRAVFLVSIHALLAECDHINVLRLKPLSGFNPRTPCGVRRNRLYTLLLNRANHTLRQPP